MIPFIPFMFMGALASIAKKLIGMPADLKVKRKLKRVSRGPRLLRLNSKRHVLRRVTRSGKKGKSKQANLSANGGNNKIGRVGRKFSKPSKNAGW